MPNVQLQNGQPTREKKSSAKIKETSMERFVMKIPFVNTTFKARVVLIILAFIAIGFTFHNLTKLFEPPQPYPPLQENEL